MTQQIKIAEANMAMTATAASMALQQPEALGEAEARALVSAVIKASANLAILQILEEAECSEG